ncbi:MAG: hypothetical protein ACK4MG_04320 [Aquabacterium sp.]|uniref:hypothetical protein n=1 Tax=Aquabacterium sp. TaxID=1872578 RepID=UPI0025EA88CE|nr:hypothetical protein [uncultured Aquabacterium sp.]
MILIRNAALLLTLGFLCCMGLFRLTGQPAWRARAMECAKWGVVLALCLAGFFALRRGAMFI